MIDLQNIEHVNYCKDFIEFDTLIFNLLNQVYYYLIIQLVINGLYVSQVLTAIIKA